MDEQTPNSKPFLIAIGGLAGSGKSTLARAIMEVYTGESPIVHINTDAVRKELWGVDPTEKLPQEAYSREFSQSCYDEVDRRTQNALDFGAHAIVDAGFATEFGRGKVEEAARFCKADFVGIWLDVPPQILRDRVDARTGDVSDADSSIVDLQLTFNLGDIKWAKFDGSQNPSQILEQVSEFLSQSGLKLQNIPDNSPSPIRQPDFTHKKR